MNILLVEDEKNLHEAIKMSLELEDYKVISAFDGKKALELHGVSKIDIIILDIMMPHINGFDVCQTIRLEDKQTPILFLSARANVDDKIKGLELGADDYLSKPFEMKELLLRIKTILKRSQHSESQTDLTLIKIGNKTLDYNSFELIHEDGTKDSLSDKQLKLLQLLISNKNNVVSRKEILQKIWKYDTIPNTRTIDNVILSLRNLIETETTSFIHSVRGVGYKYVERKIK